MRGMKTPSIGPASTAPEDTPTGSSGPSPIPKPDSMAYGGKRKRLGITKSPAPKSFRPGPSSPTDSKAGESSREFKPFPKRSMSKGFPKR